MLELSRIVSHHIRKYAILMFEIMLELSRIASHHNSNNVGVNEESMQF